MAAGTVGVAVAAEVVHAPEAAVIVVTAVVVPGGGAIAEAFFGAAHKREAAEDLACLLAALRAGDKLEDVGHGHALFGARAAGRAEVFVERHGEIVGPPESLGQSAASLRTS